jgi:hypothetical protein
MVQEKASDWCSGDALHTRRLGAHPRSSTVHVEERAEASRTTPQLPPAPRHPSGRGLRRRSPVSSQSS